MKVNIISKEHNHLLKRKEIKFNVDHSQNGGTPSRVEVSKQLASLLKTKPELIYIKNMETKTGQMLAVGEANVYDSIEQGKFMEPKYIISRNVVPDISEEDQSSEEVTEEPEEE